MPKYAVFDERGIPKAFYDADIHQNIPSDAVKITDEQWLEFINNQGRRAYVNGQIIDITNKVWDETQKVWRDKTEDEIKGEVLKSKIGLLTLTTNQFIANKLNQLDEDLADITSEAQVLEGRILYIAAKYGVQITTDQVKQKLALYVANKYSADDVYNDLKQAGFGDDAINELMPLLNRAAFIAKLLNWKEEIWQKEEELEKQIEQMSLDDLLKLDVKKLCEDAYSQIQF